MTPIRACVMPPSSSNSDDDDWRWLLLLLFDASKKKRQNEQKERKEFPLKGIKRLRNNQHHIHTRDWRDMTLDQIHTMHKFFKRRMIYSKPILQQLRRRIEISLILSNYTRRSRNLVRKFSPKAKWR